ncbi:MAG: anthranilate synthase component I family protein, partial [Candidatus Limnocylindrales bacterium]
ARGLWLERLPALDSIAPVDAAETLLDLPGLVLLESARPGRRARWSYLAADPIAVVEVASAGPDPFADARRSLARLAPGRLGVTAAPPFSGGLAGYLGYDLGRRFERLPVLAAADQALPELRLALHDLVIAWDRASGWAWLAGRAVDGDMARLERRRDELLDRLLRGGGVVSGADRSPQTPGVFVSNLDRPAFEAMVERVREEIAWGEIYQANVARRLAAPFRGATWPLYRRLRTGDPVTHAAYFDLGAGRALLSASPEPFLSLTPDGLIATDPIKGTRPRGATPEADRALARELLASAKDRAENVMIVDVLRNDLGRVSLPGTVRVPRLCRLERTGAVQHLVSTVTGQLAPGRDAFDLLAASFPGGSITGAPKIRAMEIIEQLEPVRRGPYTGAAVWLGADGAMGSSILIRTLVADGQRLTLHVGGGMTWRSDPAEEWAETVAKARGPLAALGATEGAL